MPTGRHAINARAVVAAIVYDGTLPPQHTGEPSDQSAQVEERPLLMAMSPVSGSWPCVGVGVGASMALKRGHRRRGRRGGGRRRGSGTRNLVSEAQLDIARLDAASS